MIARANEMMRVAAFKKTLHELDWTSDNSRIDIRYGIDNDELREKAIAAKIAQAITTLRSPSFSTVARQG